MDYYRKHQLWFWSYLQNWAIIFRDDANANALNHYWSLAIEEQYYLLWPLLVLLLKKPKIIVITCIILLVIVISSRVYIWKNAEDFSSYERAFLFTRLDGILIGSMLAALCRVNTGLIKKNFTTFLLVLTTANYLFYLFKKNQNPNFPAWAIAGFTTFSFLFAILVYEAVLKENRIINYILTIPALQFLGKYSYGFYIFHWPVAIMTSSFFTNISGDIFETGSMMQLILVGILTSAAGFIISIISYHFFEKYFLNLKKHFI